MRGGIGTREALAEQEAGGNSTALNELFHRSARVAASFPFTAQGMRKTVREPQKISEVFLPSVVFCFFFFKEYNQLKLGGNLLEGYTKQTLKPP